MKKVFKALAVAAASTALCASIGVAAGCSAGYNGTYNGEYHYSNWGNYYGMAVEVTVKNNIITEIKDVTNSDDAYAVSVQKDDKGNAVEWHVVSTGWEDYFTANKGWLLYTNKSDELKNVEGIEEGAQYYRDLTKGNEGKWVKWDGKTIPEPAATGIYSYSWTNADAKKWTSYENWLLQQYVGWSVADVLDIKVFYSASGEPYAVDGGYNTYLADSGLVISGCTQGSGRLLLAVQDALSK